MTIKTILEGGSAGGGAGVAGTSPASATVETIKQSNTDAANFFIDGLQTNRGLADCVIDLCDRGRVSEARQLLVDGDDPDLLLARGVCYYWLARTRSDFTHENAKDILTKAARLFSAPDRVALCRVYLGLCYWRQGQVLEARALLSRAATESSARFLALISQSALDTDQGIWRDAVRRLSEIEPEGQTSCRQGMYFSQRALAYRQGYAEVGGDYLDRSLLDYEAARHHYEIGGNVRYEAATLNNLGFLYIPIDPLKASEYIQGAIALSERIDDRSLLAQYIDTKACLLLAENRLKEAKICSDRAVSLLRVSDDITWLPALLLTRGRVYGTLGAKDLALRDFEEAVNILEAAGNIDSAIDAAIVAIKQFADPAFNLVLGEICRSPAMRETIRSAAGLQIFKRAMFYLR